MKNPELYRKTVDILFDAYFNDTLEHCNCSACAVGNIIAANMSIPLVRHPYRGLVWDVRRAWFDAIFEDENEEAMKQINSTGYSVEEIKKIERAFEGAAVSDSSREENMFNGLVAVLAVLDEIHEVTDSNELPRFEKHYQHRLTQTVTA